MDVGFQADTIGHGVGEEFAAARGVGLIAEDGTDVYFAAFEQAGAQDAVGGQAKAVASGTEGLGHGADEADAAFGIAEGQAIGNCRADAGFARAVDGDQGAQRVFDSGANLEFGDEGVFAADLGAAAFSRSC